MQRTTTQYCTNDKKDPNARAQMMLNFRPVESACCADRRRLYSHLSVREWNGMSEMRRASVRHFVTNTMKAECITRSAHGFAYCCHRCCFQFQEIANTVCATADAAILRLLCFARRDFIPYFDG